MKQKRAPKLPPVNPDANTPTEQLIDEIVPDPETWKITPNIVFYGSRPIDLIGTSQEWMLRNVVLSAKYGLYS